jgi:hypothetical protein
MLSLLALCDYVGTVRNIISYEHCKYHGIILLLCYGVMTSVVADNCYVTNHFFHKLCNNKWATTIHVIAFFFLSLTPEIKQFIKIVSHVLLDLSWNRTSTVRSIAKRCISGMWTNCVTCIWSATITLKLHIHWNCIASCSTGRMFPCHPYWRAISILHVRHTGNSKKHYTMTSLTILTKER